VEGGVSGLSGESLGFTPGEPGYWPGPPLEAERRITPMILLLLDFRLIFGRIKALVFWRKRR
jgi:hypothetical protein